MFAQGDGDGITDDAEGLSEAAPQTTAPPTVNGVANGVPEGSHGRSPRTR